MQEVPKTFIALGWGMGEWIIWQLRYFAYLWK